MLVIDALDECRANADDSILLEIITILVEHIPELPSSFRLFITSRPMVELQDLLQEPHVRSETIGVRTQRNLEDVAVYARHVLMKNRKLRGLDEQVIREFNGHTGSISFDYDAAKGGFVSNHEKRSDSSWCGGEDG